jgi:transposase InsO family protein
MLASTVTRAIVVLGGGVGRVTGAAQRCADVLSRSRPADPRGADRQRPRALRPEQHPYELYLALNGIEHRRTRIRTRRTNGFVERFNGTVLDEFFRVKMRDRFYDSVEALQDDLDAWLFHYNAERPHLGYRNQGRRPIETVNLFVSQEG